MPPSKQCELLMFCYKKPQILCHTARAEHVEHSMVRIRRNLAKANCCRQNIVKSLCFIIGNAQIRWATPLDHHAKKKIVDSSPLAAKNVETTCHHGLLSPAGTLSLHFWPSPAHPPPPSTQRHQQQHQPLNCNKHDVAMYMCM